MGLIFNRCGLKNVFWNGLGTDFRMARTRSNRIFIRKFPQALNQNSNLSNRRPFFDFIKNEISHIYNHYLVRTKYFDKRMFPKLKIYNP